MFKFVVLVSLVACALGSPVSESRPHLDGRIVGGKEISISEVPYQLALFFYGELVCGATLISPQIAVTGAHCVMGAPKGSLKVRAGSSFRNSGGVVVKVTDYVYHPQYRQHDAAVLKLETPLSLGSNISAIQLVKKTPAQGTTAIISGWGTKKYEAPLPVQLRAATVKVISQKVCASNKYGYGIQIKADMFCAAAFRKDACDGDSGGPLTVDGVLAGIGSWGVGCANKEFPHIYTDVAAIREWILDTAQRFVN